MKKADAILTADLHIRDSIPKCREEKEFKRAQKRKHSFLYELQEKHECPVLVAGDVFHHWKPSPELIVWALRMLAQEIIAVPGQHDLPNHNLENIYKSGFQVLVDSDRITYVDEETVECACKSYIEGFPYGVELRGATHPNSFNIALIHTLVYKGDPPFPGARGVVKSIMKQLQNFNLIVSGDNHVPLVEKQREQLLVNPGSFMRTTAAQAEHKPRVYLWYKEENTVEPVYLPIQQNVVSREHIETEQLREERKNAFIQRLKNDVELGLSFEHNMKRYIKHNRQQISPKVEKIIWECLQK